MLKTVRTVVLTLAVAWSLPLPAAELSDQQVARSVQQAFQRDLRLRSDDIQVSSLGGSVTLKGTVESYSAKQSAERMAKRTAGVRRVTNLLEVSPASRRDTDIAADIARRLSSSSFLRSHEIDVHVANGVATLDGRVISWAQIRQAQMVAGEVRGVKAVRNNLIHGGAAASPLASIRTDEQVQADVVAALRRDAYLAELPIEVSIEQGVVRLAGEVPNLFHKDLAAEEARLVSSVQTVDNQLIVVSQMINEALPQPMTPEELQVAVTDELDADPRVSSRDIEVTSPAAQHVILRGRVGSMFEKQTAERIARRVAGVARVESLMTVDAAGRTDEEIRDDVQSNLASDSQLRGSTVEVSVQNGEVTLAGTIPDYTGRYRAARITGRVLGVLSISNKLIVTQAEPASDETLRVLITARFGSNATTLPVAKRISVDVQDGVATLSGQVVRSSQSLEAERIARATNGVRSVINLLTLTPAAARP